MKPRQLILALTVTCSAVFPQTGRAEGENRAPASYMPPSAAEQSTQESEPNQIFDFEQRRKATRDHGLDIGLVYKGEINRVVSGGQRIRTVYLENIDVRLGLDLGKASGLKGASIFLYGLGNLGGDRDAMPSKNVGDAQVTSNIETAQDSFKLYEAWFQQTFFEERASILLGLHDLNSEFYATESSSFLFNSSFGVGKELSQAGVNGPSIFATTALAARLKFEPQKSLYFQWAMFNAQAGESTRAKESHVRLGAQDGSLTVAEMGLVLNGKLAIGTWFFSRTFDHQNQNLTDASGRTIAAQAISRGSYLLIDQKLNAAISMFLRYGVASSEVNRFSSSLTAGTTWVGPLPMRVKDRLNLGIAQAINGGEYKDSQASAGTQVRDAETVYELNYRIEILKGLALQPDFQYISSPNTSYAVPDAKVGAIRVELNF